MLDKLHRYLKSWHLSEPQLLAETPTSHVYVVTSGDERVVLKLLTPYGAEENAGAAALRHWAGRGAVRLLRVDEQAHLLEYADGDSLIPIVTRGDDEQATAIIADVLNQIHSAPLDSLPDGLTPLRHWFRALFRKADADSRARLDSRYMRAARLADDLLADPRDVRVLHGDIHHQNIRHSARGWLAFDPKGLVGERTYDAANTLCNPGWLTELVENEARLLKNAEILARNTGMELSRVLAFTFVYNCLSASWYDEEGVFGEQALRIARIVEPHVIA